MYCVRIIVFVLVILSTAAGGGSSLFPLFRAKTDSGKISVSFWFIDEALGSGSVNNSDESVISVLGRQYTRDLGCDEARLFFILCCATSIAGSLLGCTAAVMSATHLASEKKFCLCCGIGVMCFLAFACFGVCLALSSLLYAKTTCEDTTDEIEFSGFNLVEGFGLLCVSCGGFLITFIFEMCALSG